MNGKSPNGDILYVSGTTGDNFGGAGENVFPLPVLSSGQIVKGESPQWVHKQQ